MAFSSKSREFRLLGYFEKSTSMGVLLASMSVKKPPPLGLEVFYRDDDRLRFIGKLVDIIGSVEKPYAVIRLEESFDIAPRAPLYYKERRLAGRKKKSRGAGKHGR